MFLVSGLFPWLEVQFPSFCFCCCVFRHQAGLEHSSILPYPPDIRCAPPGLVKVALHCSFEQMEYIYPNNWIYLYIEFLVSVSVLDGFCLVEFSSKYELYFSTCISDNIWIFDIMVFTCWTLHFSCFLLANIHHMNWSIL